MVDLQITQGFGKIGIDLKDAQYELKQVKPDLKVEQIPAHFSMEITNPDLSIDYTPFLESLGIGGIDFVMRTYTQATQEEYMTNLESMMQIGDQIGAIENQQGIGEIIFQVTMPTEKELDLHPVAPIQISFTPGTARAQAELGGVKLQLDYGKITVENFTFPSLKVYLEQKPYLEIKAVGQMFDMRK